MKKLLISFVALSLFSNLAFADCDFSTGITKQTTGYLYTTECHVAVGNMKQQLDVTLGANTDLQKALDLKNVAITKADQRAQLWQDTALKIEDRLATYDRVEKTNVWLYFALGVLTTYAAGYAASRIYNH